MGGSSWGVGKGLAEAIAQLAQSQKQERARLRAKLKSIMKTPFKSLSKEDQELKIKYLHLLDDYSLILELPKDEIEELIVDQMAAQEAGDKLQRMK